MTMEPDQVEQRTCRFPGCQRPPMPADPGAGRPPEYCAEPGHNRAAAWRARQRLSEQNADQPTEPARPVDAARAKASEIRGQVTGMAELLTQQLHALLDELRTLADPAAAEAQIETITSEAEEKIAAATVRAATAEQAQRRAEAERAEADAAAGEATEAAQALRTDAAAAQARLTDAEAAQAALAAELAQVRADAETARREAHDQQHRLKGEVAAHTARADAAEQARDEAIAAAAKAEQQARDATARAETEYDRAARAETEAGALREQLATRTAERDAARRDVEHEKAHGDQRAADLHEAYERQIEGLRRDLDHARGQTRPGPQDVPSPATPVAGTAPAPSEKPAAKPARAARPRWHVVQLDQDQAGDLDAVVVVMSTHASEKAARNSMSRMRSKHIGKDTVYYEVRPTRDIHRRLEWDPERGRGVQRNGPPS